VEELLDGRAAPDYPDLGKGGITFKKAKREGKAQEQQKLL